MKTIHRIVQSYAPTQPLHEKRLLVCTHATPATAGFLHALTALGATVDFLPVPFSEHGEVVETLSHAPHIHIIRSEQEIRTAMARADGVIEDGARVTRRLDIIERPPILRPTFFAIEQTTNGIRYLESRSTPLPYPVINVAESPLKLRLENGIATPETIVTSLLSATRTALLDRRVLIVGYGAIGSGLATLCRAHGALVSVIDIQASRRLLSQAAGFPTYPPSTLPLTLGQQDIIISCTSNARGIMLGFPELALLRDGAVVCNAGSGTGEINPSVLQPGTYTHHHSTTTVTSDGDHLSIHMEKMGATKTVRILGGGHPLNLRMHNGTPNDAMDIVFSLMLLATIHTKPGAFAPGIHPLQDAIASEVANHYRAAEHPKRMPHHVRANTLTLDARPYGGVMKFGLPGAHLDRFSIARAIFHPGTETEGHYHLTAEEAYVIESGSADMTLWHHERPTERMVYHLEPGDSCTIPRGFVHHVRVTSPQDFISLVIASPPFSFWDQFFPDAHDPVPTPVHHATQEHSSP